MNQQEKRGAIVKRIHELAILLGGTSHETITSNSVGRTSQKIVVEYDVQENK